MIKQEHIDNFSLALSKILEREINSGNEIIETSTGWPYQETILIFLKQPFTKNYNGENIQYKNIDDKHYWKAEYFDKTTNHILACKF